MEKKFNRESVRIVAKISTTYEVQPLTISVNNSSVFLWFSVLAIVVVAISAFRYGIS